VGTESSIDGLNAHRYDKSPADTRGTHGMTEESPGRLLEDLKAFLYPYIVIGPLISALFANQIDNLLAACLLFVGFVGTAFYWFSKRIQAIEMSIKDLELRQREHEGPPSPEE